MFLKPLHQNTISMSFHAFCFVAQDECSIAVFLKIGPGTWEVPQTFRGSESFVINLRHFFCLFTLNLSLECSGIFT